MESRGSHSFSSHEDHEEVEPEHREEDGGTYLSRAGMLLLEVTARKRRIMWMQRKTAMLSKQSDT